jgi:hypothetical protein
MIFYAILYAEDGGNSFLRNADTYVLKHKASYSSRQNSSQSQLWEPEFSDNTLHDLSESSVSEQSRPAILHFDETEKLYR